MDKEVARGGEPVARRLGGLHEPVIDLSLPLRNIIYISFHDLLHFTSGCPQRLGGSVIVRLFHESTADIEGDGVLEAGLKWWGLHEDLNLRV